MRGEKSLSMGKNRYWPNCPLMRGMSGCPLLRQGLGTSGKGMKKDSAFQGHVLLALGGLEEGDRGDELSAPYREGTPTHVPQLSVLSSTLSRRRG